MIRVCVCVEYEVEPVAEQIAQPSPAIHVMNCSSTDAAEFIMNSA